MGQALDHLFHPGAVAVVGASQDPTKAGFQYVQVLQEHEFRGPIYPVNSRGQDVLDLPGYSSLLEIQGPVDYVICCIPARSVLRLIDQCAKKGVRAIQFFTGRFSETGRVEERELERQLLERAREAGIRVLGPNCMGIYYPREGLAFKPMAREPGPVGILSQSGGNLVELAYTAGLRGIRFSKMVSYGNAIDVNEADLLEYFANDPETEVIGAYIEGVRDGPRFASALSRATANKPVVILKGGRTTAGHQAVRSHTASLAGAQAVWRALAKQTGAVLVETLEELVDMLVAFRFAPPATGRRVGVVGGGGGRAVESADVCEEAGLRLEPIPEGLRHDFKGLAPDLWDWVGNPADGSVLAGSPLTEGVVLEMMGTRPEYDILIGNVGEFWFLDRPQGIERAREVVTHFVRVAGGTRKPVAIVLGDSVADSDWRTDVLKEFRAQIAAAGAMQFPSVRRAAMALSRLVAYYRSCSVP